jgi:dUTP pyrophosphatase
MHEKQDTDMIALAFEAIALVLEKISVKLYKMFKSMNRYSVGRNESIRPMHDLPRPTEQNIKEFYDKVRPFWDDDKINRPDTAPVHWDPKPYDLVVKFKKMHPDAVVPSYAKPGDVGLDMTCVSYEFKNGRHHYNTGIALEIPDGFVGFLFPRSSIMKYDLRLTNAVGCVDSGFRDSLSFVFENDAMHGREVIPTESGVYTNTCRIYQVGDRVGQLVIMPHPKINLIEVETLSDTVRGTSGFGSSGK